MTSGALSVNLEVPSGPSHQRLGVFLTTSNFTCRCHLLIYYSDLLSFGPVVVGLALIPNIHTS